VIVASTGSFASVETVEVIDPDRMVEVLRTAGRTAAAFPKPGS
jgi:hypothetical protein